MTHWMAPTTFGLSWWRPLPQNPEEYSFAFHSRVTPPGYLGRTTECPGHNPLWIGPDLLVCRCTHFGNSAVVELTDDNSDDKRYNLNLRTMRRLQPGCLPYCHEKEPRREFHSLHYVSFEDGITGGTTENQIYGLLEVHRAWHEKRPSFETLVDHMMDGVPPVPTIWQASIPWHHRGLFPGKHKDVFRKDPRWKDDEFPAPEPGIFWAAKRAASHGPTI